MTIRNFGRRVVRRLARVRYLGPIITRLVQIWKLPATVVAIDRLTNRFDAVSTGYGAALRGTDLAVARLESSLRALYVDNDKLRARLEFIRRETLFELRKQLNITGGARSERPKVQPRIIAAEKVQEPGPKKLNLGCGHVPMPAYINIDSRELPDVDVIAEIDALPFPPRSIDEIFSSHLIEHFTERILRDTVLPYWNSLLKDGGELRFVTPDGSAMLKAYGDGTFTYAQLREVIYGGQEYEGDFHFTMLTPASATALLEAAGFKDVQVIAQGRRNGDCLEFEMRGTKRRDSLY